MAQDDTAQPIQLAQANPSSACICTCSSPNHSPTTCYYELDANGGCALNGGACVNQGQVGTLSGCVKAPRPIKTSTTAQEVADATAATLADFLSKLTAVTDTK